MGFKAATSLSFRLRRTLDLAMDAVRSMTHEQLEWKQSNVPSIEWHLWHISRWVDRVQAHISAVVRSGTHLGDEIWYRTGLAQKWGFDKVALGVGDTGMEMGDELAYNLEFPSMQELLSYAEAVTDEAVKRIETLREEEFGRPCFDLYGRSTDLGSFIIQSLGHYDRHLGMIEAIRGVQGSSGTATV